MPVTVKHSMNGLAAIKKIGIPQSLFDWLHASNVGVKLSATKFQFIVPIKDGGDPMEFDVTVTLDQLQKLNAGTISSIEKIKLGKELANTIQQIKEQYGDLIEMSGEAKAAPVGGALGSLPPIKQQPASASTVASKASSGKWSAFDLSKMKTAPQVKLRDANQMYQPVHGTSPGSRYYVVAGSDDLRVAARYTTGTLSVRIEGPKLAQHSASIKAGGFELKAAKDYASVHLSVDNDQLAAKTLGAILMGLGVPLDTTLPNLNVIKGA